jgi:hypothetical protein
MEGIIRIGASEKREISASSAKLHIKLEAERIGFGNAAWQQSREVRDLVGKLKHLGLEENQISFASVRTSSPGGLLKAEAMAAAAQCQVVGVRSASDSHTLPEAASSFHESFAKAPAMSRRADMSVGMEYRATTTLEVTVTAEFIVLPV